ncbi:MAG: pyridoxal phosphate-dependent aminotransferase [Candidatus Theseobacter exili]|nr:pyridoxal phosphate-dependent aminotransferase [Candidatus Theseobacter exili]
MSDHFNFSKRILSVNESATLAISSRAKAMKSDGKDVVGFGAGEPDFDTPDHIKNAAIKAIESGQTKYTLSSGMPSLKKAVCSLFEKDKGLSYEPEQIIVSCGAKHSLYNIIQVLCESGDEVLIGAPYWVSYPEFVKLAEAKPVFVSTDEVSEFKMSPEALKKAITDKSKILILNSPSNPTGSVYSTAELEKIAEIAVKNNLFVISDEIYSQLIYDNPENTSSIASLGSDIFDRTIVVDGVSKTYSMTGWRIGYLAAPKEVAGAINRLQSHSTSNPTSIAQWAALEAIQSDQSCVLEMKEVFRQRRNHIVERLRAIPGFSCLLPQGAFYVFPGIHDLDISSDQFAKELLEEALVAVVPGSAFGNDAHLRLSYASSMENINKGIDRIENFVKAKF